jgi:hypothetical protein
MSHEQLPVFKNLRIISPLLSTTLGRQGSTAIAEGVTNVRNEQISANVIARIFSRKEITVLILITLQVSG